MFFLTKKLKTCRHFSISINLITNMFLIWFALQIITVLIVIYYFHIVSYSNHVYFHLVFITYLSLTLLNIKFTVTSPPQVRPLSFFCDELSDLKYRLLCSNNLTYFHVSLSFECLFSKTKYLLLFKCVSHLLHFSHWYFFFDRISKFFF